MPTIYLEHPRHGNKVACSEREAVYDERNGWKRYTPGVPRQEPDEPVEIPAFLANELTPRRPGRPRKNDPLE